MGRVKIKHPRPKELPTRQQLLGILAPQVKVTRLIPMWDSVVALTASDEDTEKVFSEEKLKKLEEAQFTPQMPPELRAQRTVVCRRLDEIICLHHPEAIKEEVMREQNWARVTEVYKFPKSPTIKIAFTSSEMARKATESGLLLFCLSVASHQISREVFTPLVSCNRCQEVETHDTQDCPKPPEYKVCSLCANRGHTFRECNANFRKCLNCGEGHSARAMKCPVRKRALREKEERTREARESRASYATTASTATSTPSPDNPTHLKGVLCVFHAHMVECAQPGSFQSTLSQSLALNGLPDVKLPPNPPSRDIILAVTGSSAIGRASSTAPSSTQHPGPQEHHDTPAPNPPASATANTTSTSTISHGHRGTPANPAPTSASTSTTPTSSTSSTTTTTTTPNTPYSDTATILPQLSRTSPTTIGSQRPRDIPPTPPPSSATTSTTSTTAITTTTTSNTPISDTSTSHPHPRRESPAPKGTLRPTSPSMSAPSPIRKEADKRAKEESQKEEVHGDIEEEEQLTILIVKKHSDSWPRGNKAVRKGLGTHRYLICHDGTGVDNNTAFNWVRITNEDIPLGDYCVSVEDNVFDTLKDGPFPANLTFKRPPAPKQQQ